MKTILITGGSRGIGAATALLAAETGYRVIVNYLSRQHEAEQIASEILARGGHAFSIQADISRESEVLRMFGEIDRKAGRLDALVNNAGILKAQARLENMDEERLNRILKVNVTGQMLCAREAVKRMSVRNGGHGGSIVNVSSLAARTGSPNEYIDYAVSKGALDTFTVGLAREVASEGIRVNGVRPAFIHTDIHADGGEPERIERLKPGIPLGRGGTPEEVAEAILWLISEKSAYSTGTFIDVSGGK